MGESLLFSFLSFIISLLMVNILLPTFNVLAGKQYSLNFSNDFEVYLGLMGIVILTGLVAGSYPALYISSFRPVNIFRAVTPFSFKKSGTMRKVLVVGQFAFSIILIVATLVISSQMRYVQNKDLGFNKDNIISLASYGALGRNKKLQSG